MVAMPAATVPRSEGPVYRGPAGSAHPARACRIGAKPVEGQKIERIDVGGHELRVAIGGEGPPDFVCLHGLVDTLEIWDGLGPALEARGRLVRFDQRGHGASDAPPGPYRREDLAGDAIALLDRQGIDRAILVGHSMGGIVAMTAALGWPDRVAGLVLLGTASQCSERIAEWYERIAQDGETHGTDGLARAIHDRALAEAETADERRRMEAWYALSPRPGTQPAYDLLVVDHRARLWVRSWSTLGLATRWWVFARGGDLLGSVDVPSGMKITSVRCGWVWGVEHDELDVGYVVRYALRGVDIC